VPKDLDGELLENVVVQKDLDGELLDKLVVLMDWVGLEVSGEQLAVVED